VKDNSSWNWRREEEAEISSRNSTPDVEEYEGDVEETYSGSKRSIVTEEGESWIGEDDAMGEDIGDIRSYLEGERISFPPILEKKYEEKKKEDRQEKDLIVIM